MDKPKTEHPATGGSYRRMPDGSLVPLEQPGMDEEQSTTAQAAREQLERDQAEIAAKAAAKSAEAVPPEGSDGKAARKGRRE